MTPPERTEDTYIRTATGGKAWPLNPKPEDISIQDIAASLSKLCRFGGHTRGFYSVAQHSVMVSILVPQDHALAGLLHDASEAYISDICRPIKRHLNNYAEIEDRLMRTIAEVYGFDYPLHEAVHVADRRMLVTEQRDLMGGLDHSFAVPVAPLSVVPMTSYDAEISFLQRYKELF